MTEVEVGKGVVLRNQGGQASEEKEYRAGLQRLGIDTMEVMAELKSLWGSVQPEAPMRVLGLQTLENFRAIPRSSEKKTNLLSQIPRDAKLIFISHCWHRPWQDIDHFTRWRSQRDDKNIPKGICVSNDDKLLQYYGSGGQAHPDDEEGSKHKLLCAGVRKLAEKKGWDVSKVYLWIDFCSIEQDITYLGELGKESLKGYMAMCDALLILCQAVPGSDVRTTNLLPGRTGHRAWVMLESMGFHSISTLGSEEQPPIYVAAGEEASFLERFEYVMTRLPSEGELSCEADREYILLHERSFLRRMRAHVVRNGRIMNHPLGVQCVAAHPTEQGLVASCGRDGVIRIVDRDVGVLKQALVVHKWSVNSLSFSRDGRRIASGGDDWIVKVWDLSTGKVLHSLSGHSGRVNSVAFFNNGKHIVSGSDDKTIRIWNVSDASAAREETISPLTGHENWVTSVAVSGDGKMIASGSRDCTVRMWGLSIWSKAVSAPRVMEGHTDRVSCVAFSPDGKLLVSGAWDSTVRVWNASTGLQALSMLTGHAGSILSVAFSPDGLVMSTGSNDETIRIWEVSTRKCVAGPLVVHTGDVTSVSFSSDGKIFSGSSDETVRMCDVSGVCAQGTRGGGMFNIFLRKMRHFPSRDLVFAPAHARKDTEDPRKGHSDSVLCVCFSPDGRLVASGGRDWNVLIWDASTGKEKDKVLKGHSDWVGSIAFSPRGDLLVSGSGDKTLRVWEVLTGREIVVLKAHTSHVLAVAFSGNGKLVASASSDNSVRIWDALSWIEMVTVDASTDWVNSVAFSPDDSLVASGSDDETVRVWDVSTGKEAIGFQTWAGHIGGAKLVSFSPHGEFIACGASDGKVRVWDVQAQRELPVAFEGSCLDWVSTLPTSKAYSEAARRDSLHCRESSGKHMLTCKEGLLSLCAVESGLVTTFGASVHAEVEIVSCRPPIICLGCRDGQVCEVRTCFGA